MLCHDQPLKGFYLAGEAFAFPFLYVPYWLFTSITHLLELPPGEKSRARAVSRHFRISCLRKVMQIAQR